MGPEVAVPEVAVPEQEPEDPVAAVKSQLGSIRCREASRAQSVVPERPREPGSQSFRSGLESPVIQQCASSQAVSPGEGSESRRWQ